MAPWPEQSSQSQPKAPDKIEKEESVTLEANATVETDNSPDNSNSIKSEQKSEDKDVSDLNDGQLRALLDEAYSYKCPKDREGKSELFKELLQEAEADETDSKVLGGSLGGKFSRTQYNLPARRKQTRHSGQGRECGVGVSTTRGGSLQNLHALGMEGGRRSRRRDTLVSARQREGGSLPTNVNVDSDQDLDIICPNYTSRATLVVSEPKKEENLERDEVNAPEMLKVQSLLANGNEPQNTKEEESRVADNAYASSINEKIERTARGNSSTDTASETGVGPVESGAMLYPSTPVQHVSVLSIPPGQLSAGADDHRISDSSEVKKFNVSRSRPQKKTHLTEEADNTSEGLLGLPLTAYWNRYSSFTLLDFQELDDDAIEKQNAHYSPELQTALSVSMVAPSTSSNQGSLIPFLEDSDVPPPPPLYSEAWSLIFSSKLTSSQSSPCTRRPFATSTPDSHFKGTTCSELEKVFFQDYNNKPVKSITPKVVDGPGPSTMSDAEKELLRSLHVASDERGTVEALQEDLSDSNTKLTFGNSSDAKAKPVDENGNALACVRVDSNCLDRKKQRRVKAKNDQNTILSDEIEGFRGGADIDTLMEYIESTSLETNKTNKIRTNQANGTRNNVKLRSKEEDPRSFRRRKDKFQRCNSLEEISKTKLEDLTEEGSSERVNSAIHLSKKLVTVDDAEVGKKSWTEENHSRLCPSRDQKPERLSPDIMQESEFLVVTKKQRRKKRRVVCSSRGIAKPDYYSNRETGSGRLLYQYHSEQGNSQPRRKSASSVPPSDKSDSSDLDSVHSLPVSSSSARQRVNQNSASGGSTPTQASYADIAKSAASPSDGSIINIDRHERCLSNFAFPEIDEGAKLPCPMLPLPLIASTKKDAKSDDCDNILLNSEEYPPLDNRILETCTDSLQCSQNSVKDNCIGARKLPVITVKERGPSKSSNTDIRPLESSCVKRPAVILLNDRLREDHRVPEIKFGFDVNYQLLQSDEGRCIKSEEPPPAVPAIPAPPATENLGCYAYIQDENLVNYLRTSWEEVMEKLKVGKARYYDGQ